MKKITIFVLAVFLVLVLTGCSKKQQGQNTSGGSGEQTSKQEQKKEGSSIIEDIKDAMSSGKKMKCTYTVTQGENVMQSEAFVEGDRYKVTTTFNGQGTKMIFDGKDTYTWTDQSKQGMKMTTECMENIVEDVEDTAGEMEEDENFHAENPFENAVDVKCEKVGSIDFSIPSDVEFVDQCELMKNQEKQMEEMMKSMSQGIDVPVMQ
ncbi:MAG: hypothetical protein U9O20_03495 [Patescibacteria group bacterium]|nr:hypothetical protein [Patescibacteria group bacterium]